MFYVHAAATHQSAPPRTNNQRSQLTRNVYRPIEILLLFYETKSKMKYPYCHVSFVVEAADLLVHGLYSVELGGRRAVGASWLWIISMKWTLPKPYSMSLQLFFMRSLMIV